MIEGEVDMIRFAELAFMLSAQSRGADVKKTIINNSIRVMPGPANVWLFFLRIRISVLLETSELNINNIT